MKKARVVYNNTFDSFDIEILTDEGWGLCTRYTCQNSTKNPDSEPNMIHFSALNKLSELQWLGYHIDFTKLQ